MTGHLEILAEAADDFFRRECPTEVATGDGRALSEKFRAAAMLEGAGLAEAATVASAAARYAAPFDVAADWLAGEPEASRRLAGAALRAAQLAGALERVLQLAVEHASTRVQFGQPLRRFQAVGQQLAILAGEVAAARAAADAATADPVEWKVAAAKIRAGEAAGRGAAIGHQVLGAIGFTDEHPLHLFTRLLWRWRDEYGTEMEWAVRLGAYFHERDPWAALTDSEAS